VKSAAQRITHYNNRMTSTQIDPVLTAVSADAQANFATYATDWVALQTLVHQYLDAQGALPSEYFNYNAWAGEIYHLANHFSGAAAIAAGSGLILKYLGMGCTGARLRGVAAIFGIVIP